MRPFFFRRYTAPAPDKRAEQYRAKQREQSTAPRIGRGRSILLSLLALLPAFAEGLFGAREELAAWLRVSDTGLSIRIVKAARDKSLAAARAKRERRKERNRRWWANDKTWRRA
jgi:hypothetical protein